jgi:alpha-N-acetylglucosaminidase
VNLTRQVLAARGLPLVRQVEAAYGSADRPALLAAEAQVLALLRDLNRLTATRPEFLLGRWIEDARRWGTNAEERRLYEWNARNLITLWGTRCTEGQNDDLNLYAYKEWEGMFSSYYLPRWQKFFDGLNEALARGTPFDRADFAARSCDWEQRWSKETMSFRTAPTGDAIATARALAAKWHRR